jgi:type IV secretion system protein VirB5
MKVLAAVLLLLFALVAKANYPVFDASNFAKMVETVEMLQRELAELRATYNAVSGTRNLGAILYNPALRQYLPDDWRGIYDAAAAGGYAGLSGNIQTIAQAERLPGTVEAQMDAVRARSTRAAQTNKAVALNAYEGEKARLTEIEGLMQRVNGTSDMKGVAEIQARIGAEQAVIANEATKLQLVAMLQQAEERLEAQQRHDLAQKILSPRNTGMPSCCAAR